jgi:F0F1-type ATP synthase assembly protein I
VSLAPGAPRSPLGHVSAGFEVIGPLVLLMGLGYWIDGRFSSAPWFLLIGALLGLVVGFYNLFRRFLPRPPRGGGTQP